MIAEQIDALVNQVHRDERQLAEIAGNTRFRLWAKELRQQLRGNRGMLEVLRAQLEAQQ